MVCWKKMKKLGCHMLSLFMEEKLRSEHETERNRSIPSPASGTMVNPFLAALHRRLAGKNGLQYIGSKNSTHPSGCCSCKRAQLGEKRSRIVGIHTLLQYSGLKTSHSLFQAE